MSTSALPILRQALRQHPHAVATAGPQLQGSERTGHRWTSMWNLPSSMSTAGPQRSARMPENMPDKTPDKISERISEDMPDKVPECLPDKIPENMSDRMPEGIPNRM